MENKKYKILHIITGLGTGGAEMSLYRILTRIDTLHYIHAVISLTESGTIGEKLVQFGIYVRPLNMPRGIPTLRGIIALVKVIRQFRPDLIQTWMYHANIAGIFCSLLSGKRIPVCWNIRHSLHELKSEKRSTRIIIGFNALLSRMASVIIYNSLTASIQHTTFGFSAKFISILPNGFDTNVFKPDPEKKNEYRKLFGANEQTILVGLFGRYHPLKDHETFMEAASLVTKKRANVLFLCAGSGVSPDNRELMKLIELTGLSNNIILLGERQDIPWLTAALDIAILSSKSEAFPNVVGEAMSCEVPCVVTNVGDASALVEDTGIVVPSKSPGSLASGIISLIDAGLIGRSKMGARARNIIIEKYGIAAIAKMYETLYTGILLRSNILRQI